MSDEEIAKILGTEVLDWDILDNAVKMVEYLRSAGWVVTISCSYVDWDIEARRWYPRLLVLPVTGKDLAKVIREVFEQCTQIMTGLNMANQSLEEG